MSREFSTIRKFFLKLNLQAKFIYPLSLIFLITFTIFTLYLINDQRVEKYDQMKQSAERTADLISYTNSEFIYNLNEEALKISCNKFFTDKSISLLTIKETSGSELISLKRNTSENKNDIEITKKIIKDENTIAILKLKYSSQYIEKSVFMIGIKMIILSIIIISLLIFSLWYVTKISLNPLKIIYRVLNRVVLEKDLTQKVNIIGKDEIAGLATFIDDFLSQLKTVLSEVNSASSEIKESSQVLFQSMKEITSDDSNNSNTKSVKALMKGMEHIMNTVTDQVSTMEETSAAVVEISESIRNVSKNADHTQIVSTESMNIAKEGGDIFERTIEGILNVEDIVKSIEGKSIKLDRSSKMIGDILNVINDISEQTNLLSLNAAIEAARAGDAGKGFAVVADEIQKLASNSQNLTGEIDTLVKEIQNEIKDVVDAIQAGYKEVSESSTMAKNAQEILNEIIDKMDITNQEISNISVAVEEQSLSVEEIRTAIEGIAEDSENIENLSKEQFDGLTNIVISMENVVTSANSLSKVSITLNNIVNEFKL